MTARYFAYGSNLTSARLVERVPSARAVGPALLRDFRLTLDKRGADGSGKANLAPAPGGSVWGVVYTFDPAEWVRLDACEPRYVRIEVDGSFDVSQLAQAVHQPRDETWWSL